MIGARRLSRLIEAAEGLFERWPRVVDRVVVNEAACPHVEGLRYVAISDELAQLLGADLKVLLASERVDLDAIDVLEEIAEERWRQISDEGFDGAGDDRLTSGQLAQAAAVYAMTATVHDSMGIRDWWPAEVRGELKPRDPRRDLVRAAALIVAEIERLDRAEKARA